MRVFAVFWKTPLASQRQKRPCPGCSFSSFLASAVYSSLKAHTGHTQTLVQEGWGGQSGDARVPLPCVSGPLASSSKAPKWSSKARL